MVFTSKKILMLEQLSLKLLWKRLKKKKTLRRVLKRVEKFQVYNLQFTKIEFHYIYSHQKTSWKSNSILTIEL